MCIINLLDENRSNPKIERLEAAYWGLLREIDLNRNIKPTNVAEERALFFSKLNNNEIYNPQFTYVENVGVEYLETLYALQTKFENINGYISEQYSLLINKNIENITNFAARKSADFPRWLSSLYGKPNEDTKLYAQKILETKIDNTEVVADIESAKAKEILEEGLRRYHIEGWQVVEEDITAKAMVKTLNNKVIIQRGALFSKPQLERLIIHEIGVHVRRSANGAKHPSLLYRFGFHNYIETEEGLALYHEKMHGLIQHKDMIRYACRVMAAEMAFEKSFYEIFDFSSNYLSQEESFDLALRIKRGLLDTSQWGGYTKDQVYLSGFLKVSSLKPEEIEWLMQGKLAQLPQTKKIKNL